MPERTLSPDDVSPIREDVQTLSTTVRALAIVDEASFQAAGTFLRRIKALRDTIAGLFGPHITRAFDAHRALVADRKRLDAPLVDAERVLKTTLAAFTIAEERRRAAQARQQTAAATETRTAEIWAEVEELEGAGYHVEAADLATELVTASAAIVITPAPLKADGLARRQLWKYEVIDAAQVPREYLTVDHPKLGAVVRALKGAVQIPGVRVWVERTIAATRT